LKSTTSDERVWFCSEPWTGSLSITVDQDVVLCPCYLQLRIGNLKHMTIQEAWNAPALLEIRSTFADGRLPTVCEGQLCPVVLGEQPEG
jgi:hypothetical protein